MTVDDLKGIQLNTFTLLHRGVIVFLLRTPIKGFDLSIEPVTIENLTNVQISDMCLGEDGVHVGYIFQVPAHAKINHNTILIRRPSTDEELMTTDSYLVAEIPGALIYSNDQGSLAILSGDYKNNITRNL
ncbi:hypothetical protein GR11A_00009 [Vibrio phage vB_VcorM_GR11A]|nr:hypothetical protein GR11A_00009 [Vibrio phage vB_VcorM_GR11A]